MSIETAGTRVEAIIDSRYKVTNVARGHVTISDEPAEAGGADSAMDPQELLLTALASCKLATMRMVAKRKVWNTDGLKITLELEKLPEKTIIRQTISFPDHLNEEQRAKLTSISHKCPVSKMVTGELQIVDK